MEFLMHVMPDSPRKTIKSILTHHQVSVGGVPVSQYDFPLSKEDVVIVSKNPIRRKQTPVLAGAGWKVAVINRPVCRPTELSVKLSFNVCCFIVFLIV